MQDLKPTPQNGILVLLSYRGSFQKFRRAPPSVLYGSPSPRPSREAGHSALYNFSRSIPRDSTSVSVTCHVGSNICSFKSTWSVCMQIRVTGLCVDSIIFYNVFKSIIRQTTSTSTISIFSGAVDQILFTEGDEFSCFLKVLSFQWSGSAERPARSTLPCVVG